MKTLIGTAALMIALGGTAYAETGNIAGNNFPGEPVNSSFKASARAPGGGHTPGWYATEGRRAHAMTKTSVKKKKVKHRTTVGTGY